MKRRQMRMFVVAALAVVCAGAAGAAPAADAPPVQARERVYGSQLMTPAERQAQRARMRAAQSAEERARLRQEHHAQMQERAQSQGQALPATPPPAGRGPGRQGAPGRGR